MAAFQQAASEEIVDYIAAQNGSLTMFEFFRGWKRKAGCVTLVLACAFSIGWVRSLRVCDQLSLELVMPKTLLQSRRSSILIFTDELLSPRTPSWSSSSLADIPPGREIGSDPKKEIHWFFQWGGLQYGELPFEIGRREVKFLIIPYSPIIIPLTLLTAWLLLSKPGAKRQPPITPASENP